MATKNPGKTEWAGRRRPVTRKSGYISNSELRFRRSLEWSINSGPTDPLIIDFHVPATESNQWVGWGGYLHAPSGTSIEVQSTHGEFSVGDPQDDAWLKIGGLWREDASQSPHKITVIITPTKNAQIGIYELLSGIVDHPYLNNSRPALLRGMSKFAPEANFYLKPKNAEIFTREFTKNRTAALITKSCNRCGRFLPINFPNELSHLAFTNHCKARRPCVHSGFGRIAEEGRNNSILQFDYGFQLECRFCKKFEVNGALNPQRTMGQMKEDGARRRHFELLLEHLLEGSDQLRYKNKNSRDLAEDIWDRFDRKCFKCGIEVFSQSSHGQPSYNLDHTRPLAMLWPLDETATCLCRSCNSAKRDRAPSDFYTSDELGQLSKLTGISLEELKNPRPNINALKLIDLRREWLYDEFLKLPELQKIREGKKTSELVIKALNRVIDMCPDPKPIEKF